MKSDYIDVLAAISCLAVVSLHVNGVYWNYSTCQHWWLSNAIESLCYFGAPVFFMISGCTLIDYRERYGTLVFFRKRFYRIVMPFLFWSFVATITVGGGFSCGVKRFIISVINGSSLPVYWFFIQLFACYLSFPILGAIQDKRRIYAYMIVYSFLSISCLGFVGNCFGHPVLGLLKNPLGGGVIVLLLLGYWIGHFEIKKSHRVIIYCAGIVGLLSHLVGTAILTEEAQGVCRLFKGYVNWPCVLYSASVFTLIRHLDWGRHVAFLRVIRFVRESSYGIYLTHAFLIYHILPALGLDGHNVLYRLLGPIMIVVVLSVMLPLIKRIPYVKFVLP